MLLQAPAHSFARSTDYRAVFDGLAESVLVLDPAGVLIGASPAALAAAGRWLRPSLSQPLGESTWWRSPEVAERFQTALELAAGGDPSRCEAEVQGVGGCRHIEIALTPILKSDGSAHLVLAQLGDVPVRQRADMPLRESEKLLRQITETIHEVFWMTNPRGDEILYVSPGYETIWGRSVESVCRNPLSFLEAIHPADRSRVIAGLARQARGNHVEEFRVLHPDGTVRWVRNQAFPVRNDEGEVYRVTGIATDITEQVQAREEVARLNRELEARIAERTRELTAEIAERGRVEELLRARGEQILVHRDALLELARLDKSDFPEALHQILKASAETLEVERASYWTLAEDDSTITCETLYLRSRDDLDQAAAGLTLARDRYPRYFAAMCGDRPIVAHRASENAATAEFGESYLGPLGITSMMDVPVWFHGRVLGVICHEHVGAPRDWTLEEVDFANSLATMVSLSLETSKRQQLLSDLQKSEEKYRKVVENANEGIVVVQEGYVRFANAKALEFAGRPEHEVYSTPFQEMAHPDDRAVLVGNYLKRMHGEPAPDQYEFRVLHPDGAVRWLSVRAVRTEWEGRPGSLNFLTDITESKRLRDNLAQTLAEQEAILQTSMVGIVFLLDRRVHWLNATLEQQMLGYEQGELIGQVSAVTYAHPEDYERVNRECYPLLAAGESFATELEMKRKDGSIFWCSLSGKAIDPSNPSAGSIWVLSDIAVRRQLEEELSRTLTQREAILRSTLVGITFSVHRRHVWLNEKVAQMLGYRVDELTGQCSVIHFPDEQAWADFGAVGYAALARGEAYIAETQMKRKDGTLIWCQVYGEAIDPNDLGAGTIWTFLDITDQKRAQEDIRRALAKERELSELKSRFVSMTSHEFRTPLATILSSAELLEDYGDRLPAAEKTELIDHVKAAVTRMTRMLDDVLIIGKADAGRVEFNPAPCDPRGFCLGLLDEMRRASNGSHELAFAARGSEEMRLLDCPLLRHVLSNLLGNAIKYSPRGELVRLELDCRDDATVFEVIDRGIGIPDEDKARLFATFTRGRNVANISGTGLGLAIVKRLVDLHGGSIGVESEVGRGSRFTVQIPVVSERVGG
jgi:PAS domain S-box-containing protein